MMQMQPHLQHHSQPPMHPGQAQPQPPPHHMQMNQMTAQQQQQMIVQQQQQQQQQQMGMSPQQQMQQNHLTNANMNGMMNMGMTPPQSHYMNQQVCQVLVSHLVFCMFCEGGICKLFGDNNNYYTLAFLSGPFSSKFLSSNRKANAIQMPFGKI